jgi:hypothetical protein
VTLGDALTLVGLAVAVFFYALQRASDRRRDVESALGLLRAVRHGMGETVGNEKGWAAVFYGSTWTGDALDERAQEDYDAVMKGGYNQVFETRVPSAPLEALIVAPGAGGLIAPETIQAANHALYQVGVFNQLVRQQTEFWRQHLAEIADRNLEDSRREAIARAAKAQSRMLHASGIGAAGSPGGWFSALTTAVDVNISTLEAQVASRWWGHRGGVRRDGTRRRRYGRRRVARSRYRHR